MLPLPDGIPARRSPIVNVLLIAANFAVFIFYELPQPQRGGVPRLVLPVQRGGRLPGAGAVGLNWITAMFLHGGWDHILGNMLFQR